MQRLIRKQRLTLWLVTILLTSPGTSGCNRESSVVVESHDDAAGTPEQDPNEKQAEQQSPLTVTLQHFHYDAKCKLLRQGSF